MSLPKCFELLNVEYFINLELSLTGMGELIPPNATLAELTEAAANLQALVNGVYADISLLESTITSQIALIEPLLALVTAPGADLAAIVTWIETFITSFLNPIIIPYTTGIAQLAALATQVASLTAAIEELAATKLPGFTITIPPVTIGCTL